MDVPIDTTNERGPVIQLPLKLRLLGILGSAPTPTVPGKPDLIDLHLQRKKALTKADVAEDLRHKDFISGR